MGGLAAPAPSISRRLPLLSNTLADGSRLALCARTVCSTSSLLQWGALRPLFVTLILTLFSSTAIAGHPRPKALVIIDWRGQWAKEDKLKMLDSLAEGLDKAGLDRVEEQVSGFVLDERFRSCIARESCRFEYARATEAQFVIAAIFVSNGEPSSAVMTLYNVPMLSESTVAVRKGKRPERVVSTTRTLVAELLYKERKLPRGTLEVASAPPGDSVFIDGHAAGLTNLSQLLYAGPHVVRIERRGVAPHITKVEVLADKLVHYEARFEKSKVPGAPE
jgi:hypothetical protein